MAKWWEEYRCGCVSKSMRRKRDLPGYCPKHGDDSRGAQQEIPKRVIAQHKALERAVLRQEH